MKQKISFIPNLFALSALYLLAGCASVLMDSEQSTDNIKNLNENFTIEGKFKLSYSDSKETGYFDLKKYNNSVSITLGKNYLLPEEVFVLDIREKLRLNRFIEQQNIKIDLPIIPIRDFLQLFLEAKQSNLKIDKTIIKLQFENSTAYPSKIFITSGKAELIIVVKKIWKN